MNNDRKPLARLKSLELQGYKTFASKSRFEFGPSVTTIIGPNGSGKSNIADSIRWVLGEQSYSLLRGKKTEDMIFSGSETRPRASMASATITFDNSDGWLPIDFNEVSIGRRAYRDSTNEYWLNGQRVRLRDVSEILAKCGLGQRTYTIIGQGLVDTALSLKAEERRGLFEEAAGIGLYRTRRGETLRRLDTTRRNIERVLDILSELRPRFRSLERQARRAKDYKQVQIDLRQALRVWYGYEWYHLQGIIASSTEKSVAVSTERDKLRREQSDIMKRLSGIRGNVGQLRYKLHESSQDLSELYSERESRGRRLAVNGERIRWLEEQSIVLQTELDALQRTDDEFAAQLPEMETAVDHARAAFDRAEAEFKNLEAAGVLTKGQRAALEKKSQETRESLEILVEKRAEWSTRLSQYDEQVQNLTTRIGSQQAHITGSEKKFNQEQEQLSSTRAELAQVRTAESDAQQALKQARQATNELEVQLKQQNRQLRDVESRKSSLEARHEVLKRLPTDDGAAEDHLIKAAEVGKLTGLGGRFAAGISIETRFTAAIYAALGDFNSGLTFEGERGLQAAIDLLDKEAKSGRAALLPKAGYKPEKLLKQPSGTGCLGNAAELVSTEESMQPLVQLLLGQVLVAEDRTAARSLAGSLPAHARIVTLNGDIFFPDGRVLLGRGARVVESRKVREKVEKDLARVTEEHARHLTDRDQAAAALEKAHATREACRTQLHESQQLFQNARLQVKQHELSAQDAEREFKRQQSAIHRNEEQIKQNLHDREQFEARGVDFDAQRATLRQTLESIRKRIRTEDSIVQMVQAEAELDVARRDLVQVRNQVSDLKTRRQETAADVDQRQQKLQGSRTELETLQVQQVQAEQDLQHSEEKLARLNEKNQTSEEGLRAAEAERAELEGRENELRRTMQEIERRYSTAQIELARREEELSSLKRRIEDDFGLVTFEPQQGIVNQDPLPFDGLVQRLPRVKELPENLQSQVQSLKAQLRRIGAINPEAQQEYEEVDQRIVFMDTQIEDLQQAEQHLQEVIAELDLLMEREFRKTFDEVALAFKDTFSRLFGGGGAKLTLTNPDDVNNSGIDIEARLPGKREQGLAMLSGGERSLTACALVFALLRVAPTPFCVLDEVDAMLDETNVVRFREMLTELSKTTQFIVITHNRQTVQAAEIVYGVSMGGDSATRVISLKLDEAARHIEEEEPVAEKLSS